ncbi:RNA-directed DNA polymerase from mobile element jockey [Eumeta japonica]|uniref:RNA-directed DNA polymerase from mobile element jockey n=1 Tax=Eumeta variegata TaxID=151549 RepID=A0A4C1U3M4_EUMVA|nr:RNA-directed DNA polymerase from mobile element jockey [Eumeta japonica]
MGTKVIGYCCERARISKTINGRPKVQEARLACTSPSHSIVSVVPREHRSRKPILYFGYISKDSVRIVVTAFVGTVMTIGYGLFLHFQMPRKRVRKTQRSWSELSNYAAPYEDVKQGNEIKLMKLKVQVVLLQWGTPPTTKWISSDDEEEHFCLRAIDELGQWFRNWRIEVNPEKSQHDYKYLGVTLDKNLHFRDPIECVRKTALFYKARLGAMVGRKSKLSRRYKRTIYKMCIMTVMTYVFPVFAHAAPTALDGELPTLSKYKDSSKRFFDIAGSHPNALLRAAVDYEPPHSSHFILRPRSVLNDPPDALTAAVESFNDVNDTHD